MVDYVIARGTIRCSCGDVKDLEVRGEFPEFEALQTSVKKLEKANRSNKRFKRWVADKIANPKKNQGGKANMLETCDKCSRQFDLGIENVIAILDEDRKFVKFGILCPTCIERKGN